MDNVQTRRIGERHDRGHGMKKTLVALRTTVSLGKVTVLQDDNPRSGCVAIADFGEVKQYGVGSTYSEALDDFIRSHGIQIHEIEA